MSNFQKRHMEAIADAIYAATLSEWQRSGLMFDDERQLNLYRDGMRAMNAAVRSRMSAMLRADNPNFSDDKFTNRAIGMEK